MNRSTSPLMRALATVTAGAVVSCTSVEKVDETSRGDEARGTEPEPPASAIDASVVSEPEGTEPPSAPPPLPEPSLDSSDAAVPSNPSPAAPEPPASVPAAAPERPSSEPSSIDNRGVWILSDLNALRGGLAARGTGSEWEYYWTDQSADSGIDGTSNDDVWIVGHSAAYFDGVSVRQYQLTQWDDANGSDEWRVPVEVSSISEQEVWAVSPFPGFAPLRFDGTDWSVEALSGSVFFDVWGSAIDDVWVTSSEGVDRFDGSWTHIDAPREGASWLQPGETVRSASLWGSAPNDVWVGMRWHYDGNDWTEHDVPDAPIRVWGAGPGDMWALVLDESGVFHLKSFEDGTWTERPLPSFPESAAMVGPSWGDIYGRSGDDLWLVGTGIATDGAGTEQSGGPLPEGFRGFVFHYDGEAWTEVTPPLLSDRRVARAWVAPD